MRTDFKTGTRRVGALALCSLLAAFALCLGIVTADDRQNVRPFVNVIPVATQDDTAATGGWKGTFMFGLGTADEEGTKSISGRSAGRAAEYYIAETSPFFGVNGFYDGGSTYAQIAGEILNGDNFSARMTASAARQLLLDVAIERFIHRLDNDRMTDWTARPYTVDPKSAASEMQMRATVLNGSVRYKPEGLPSGVVFAHVKLLAREGDRQARTLDHCTSCHVSAQTQTLDQRTLALVAGAEYARAPYAVRYEHEYRTFEDSSSAMSYTWGNRFGNFDLEGTLPFSVVPGNTRNTDIAAARADLGTTASAMVRVRRSETENDTTGHSLESTSFSGRLTVTPVDWARVYGRYDWFDTTNDVPLASNRETNRFRGALIVQPMREVKLEGLYTWEKTERSGGTEIEETSSESFRVKAMLRPNREWRITASHSFVDRENPFGRILRNSFSRIDDVILSPFGTDENVSDLSVVWSPMAGASFNAIYHRLASESDTHNLDTTLQHFSAGGSWNVSEKMTLYGNYLHYANEFEKNIYLGVLAPFLTIAPLPYEGTGNTFTVGAWYDAGFASIRPSWNYTTAESSFNDSAIGSGISNRSAVDATINRLSLELGLPIWTEVDLTLGYYLDDYEDAAQPQDDGTVHWLYVWFGYQF